MTTIFHNYKICTIEGKEINLKNYRKNLLLVVTVSSYDGHARHNLETISNLADIYHKKGLRVFLFPCAKYFIQPERVKGLQQLLEKYNENIVLCGLTNINGKEQHPLIKYCLDNDPNAWADRLIALNFDKFLVNSLGNVVCKYGPYELIENNKQLISYLDETFDKKTMKTFMEWVDMPDDVKKEYLYILTKDANE